MLGMSVHDAWDLNGRDKSTRDDTMRLGMRDAHVPWQRHGRDPQPRGEPAFRSARIASSSIAAFVLRTPASWCRTCMRSELRIATRHRF